MQMMSGGVQLINGVPSSDEWSQSGEIANVGEIKFFKNKNGETKAAVIIDPHKEVSEERFYASESEIPEVGDTESIMGVSCCVTEARKIYANDDCARVRITGRTLAL